MNNGLRRNALEVFQYRSVLGQLVHQYLTLRYRRTAMGYLWTLINPLLTMSIMSVVFATLFNQDLATFSVFLFSGMVPWNCFSTIVTQSCSAFLQNEGLIKKIYLPKVIFPLSLSLGVLIDSALAFVALFLIILLFGAPISWALLFIPVAFSLLFLFSLGIGLMVSVATVFFRDLQHVIGILMQAWFFLTPVFYRHEALTANVAWVVALNPMVPFIELFRAPLSMGCLPSVTAIISAVVFTICSMVVGFCVFLAQEYKLVFRL